MASQPTTKPGGYPHLARKIGAQPEYSIYRSFGALHAENLLYFQAELADLEKRLQEQQQLDSASTQCRKSKYSQNWYWLRESNSAEDGDTAQIDLILKIRQTLKEYSHAQIQEAHVLSYSPPDPRDLAHLQNFLDTGMHQPLTGADALTWGTVQGRMSPSHVRPSADLITLRPRPKEESSSHSALEKMIAYVFQCGFARFTSRVSVHRVTGYRDVTVGRVTHWMTSIIASLIPIASIVILYVVHSVPARLGIIAGFNVLVSVCLSGLTNAKRSEIFAVTAAFAAVQVVFVSSDKVL